MAGPEVHEIQYIPVGVRLGLQLIRKVKNACKILHRNSTFLTANLLPGETTAHYFANLLIEPSHVSLSS